MMKIGGNTANYMKIVLLLLNSNYKDFKDSLDKDLKCKNFFH